ncbi:MAG: PQQ-dependent sugar dehydrogenase [Roseovarius sp.]|nr:PQQ-dependent sugar dehydrogenase [Roseovarius sp.]
MKRFYVAVVAIICLLGGGSAALVHFDTRFYKSAKSLVWNIKGESAEASFASTFVRLEGARVPIELPRPNTGGGITRIGEGVLLLAGDGTMLHASSPEDVRVLSIAPPENGFASYEADIEGRFSHLYHNTTWFRYNDILAVNIDAQSSLIASFTRYYNEDACYGTAVARLDLPQGDLADMQIAAEEWITIYETQPCLPLKEIYRALEGHTAGGRIAHDGAGNVYLGSGDYGFDGVYAPFAVSQDDNYDHGKLVRISADGSGHEIIGKGLRNMQGVAWFKNAVWTVEHGMRGGDELNRIVKGGNYGWPVVTYGTQYNRQFMPGTADAPGRHEGYEKPVFSWLPSVAISSLNVMEDVHPAWNGDLLMASLGGKALFRIRLENSRALFAERIPVDMRVRYAQPVNGGLVLWNDDRELVFLRARDIFDGDPVAIAMDRLELSRANRRALAQKMDSCIECHSAVPGDHRNAPSIALLHGRPIASSGYGGYSDALLAAGGIWTSENLRAYLGDPQAFAPGTLMPDPGIDNPETLDNLVKLILELSKGE